MSVQNMLVEIQLSYNQFTKTEKKIADYVMKNPTKVMFMSITELSDECGIAEASVHRFCRKVGAKGYQEFKMKLSLSTAGDKEASALDLSEDQEKNKGDLFAETLANHLNCIKETNALLDRETVDRVVNLMVKANTVYFWGIGDSQLVAEAAMNRFSHITPKVRSLQDPYMQAMTVSLATEEDVIFFISYSGANAANEQVAQIAKSTGAKIVVITRFLKSPLTDFADEIMICGSDEGPIQGGAMGAKISQMHIIDILFQLYYAKSMKESKQNIEKTSRAVSDKDFTL